VPGGETESIRAQEAKSKRLKIARSPVQARDCPLKETPGNSGGFFVSELPCNSLQIKKSPQIPRKFGDVITSGVCFCSNK
jgi:hypothetical protein